MAHSGINMNVPVHLEQMTWSIAPVPPTDTGMKVFLPPLVPFSHRLPPPSLRLLPTGSKHNTALRCPCSCRVCYQHSQNLLNSVSQTRSMFEDALGYITSTMDSLLSTLGLKTVGDKFF